MPRARACNQLISGIDGEDSGVVVLGCRRLMTQRAAFMAVSPRGTRILEPLQNYDAVLRPAAATKLEHGGPVSLNIQ